MKRRYESLLLNDKTLLTKMERDYIFSRQIENFMLFLLFKIILSTDYNFYAKIKKNDTFILKLRELNQILTIFCLQHTKQISINQCTSC